MYSYEFARQQMASIVFADAKVGFYEARAAPATDFILTSHARPRLRRFSSPPARAQRLRQMNRFLFSILIGFLSWVVLVGAFFAGVHHSLCDPTGSCEGHMGVGLLIVFFAVASLVATGAIVLLYNVLHWVRPARRTGSLNPHPATHTAHRAPTPADRPDAHGCAPGSR
ncbi:hypothetical protein [Roseateles amylovorans]|uniref:DUF485 domain-containing protein n=1 Tax=Roseateles amylovorans TaxID=2978473 RepID=A0ABY6AXI5_9BURK|nr:hypothetical protein [Roseateles amylovorans]UXH77387.1 hypothetical protein N4261_20635 [Roseateles amylovorans]